MGALDKVLLAAAEAAADDYDLPEDIEDQPDWDEADADDVSGYLAGQSPWYARVLAGESPGEPYDGDNPVSATARTAEASTVPEPTGKPGGPGLFRIKGRELPPYVQHLYKHLVGRYGKHRAYGVAIGVVKKWAAGINPGGKGKGHKTHADVRAAAAKNVANWEESKAMAHAKPNEERHVRATVPRSRNEVMLSDPKAWSPTSARAMALANVKGYEAERFGRIVHVSNYVRKGDKAPFSGTLVGKDADEAIKAGKAIGEFGEPTGYFQTSDGKRMWGWYGAAGLLARHKGQDGKTRYLLQKRAPWVDEGNTYSVPGGALDHDHGVPESPVAGALREGREEGMVLPESARPAEVKTKTFGEGDGAWSYHTVVMDTPHFDPGAEGSQGESRGYIWATPEEMADLPLHRNFRATAEELGMPKGGGTKPPERGGFDPGKMNLGLAAPANRPSGRPYAQSMLPKPPPIGTAPGARGLGPLAPGYLRHAPSQTVAAGPPLPPGTTLPSAKEADDAAALIAKLDDTPTITGAAKHLESAATKLSNGEYLEALHNLRSAQAGVRAAHRDRLLKTGLPVANVFSTSLDPDEHRQAQQQIGAQRAETASYKEAATAIAEMIDRIRRFHFHGQLGSWSLGRFTADVPDPVALVFGLHWHDRGPASAQDAQLRRHAEVAAENRAAASWRLNPSGAHLPAGGGSLERVRAHARRGPHGVEQVRESFRYRHADPAGVDVSGPPSHRGVWGDFHLGIRPPGSFPIGHVERRGLAYHGIHEDGTDTGPKASSHLAAGALVDYNNQRAAQHPYDPARVKQLEADLHVGQDDFESRLGSALRAKAEADAGKLSDDQLRDALAGRHADVFNMRLREPEDVGPQPEVAALVKEFGRRSDEGGHPRLDAFRHEEPGLWRDSYGAAHPDWDAEFSSQHSAVALASGSAYRAVPA